MAIKNNVIQGENFSFTPSQKEIYTLSSQKFNEIDHNLGFILSHFQGPFFLRNIMTKHLVIRKRYSTYRKPSILEHQTMRIAGSTLIHHLLSIMALIELPQVF